MPRPVNASPTEEPRLGALVRKVWRRIAMRGITASDSHRQLDHLYALPDPWHMESVREQFRFEMTNELVRGKLGRVGTILEIGCGEGHQSRHLTTLCDQLYGLDVSPRAVARARRRVPDALIEVGTLQAVPWTPPGGRFDLVLACEVLYYMRDVPEAVNAMATLGDACLVTFFGPSAKFVAASVHALPGVERGWFFHEPYAWLWAFWRPQHD